MDQNRVAVQADIITIDNAPKDSFFSALIETDMDKTIDLEAYFMYKLATLKITELNELCDKYCIEHTTLSVLGTELALDQKFQVSQLSTLIEQKEYELVGRIIATKKWDEIYETIIAYPDVTELYTMKDSLGDNLLMYSIVKNPELAEAIIASNICDYNHTNNKKFTALMLACYNDRAKLAMLLLDTGKCDITLSRTTTRLTALSYAKKARGLEDVAAKLEALSGGPKIKRVVVKRNKAVVPPMLTLPKGIIPILPTQ